MGMLQVLRLNSKVQDLGNFELSPMNKYQNLMLFITCVFVEKNWTDIVIHFFC